QADALADRLAEAGFPRLPGAGRDHPVPGAPGSATWEERVHGGADPARPVALHVRPADSPAVSASLLRRDWLRADPAARAAYAERKRAAAGTGSAEAYREALRSWWEWAWPRARDWADRTGWRPPAA